MKNRNRKPLIAFAALRICAATLCISVVALCIPVTALCLSLTACARSGGNTDVSDISDTADPSASGTSGTADAINKPLFEMYSDEKTINFTHNFDIDAVVSLSYYRDNFETIVTDDKAAIQAVYDGLAAVTVTREYTENIIAADAASSITFTLSNNSEVIFRFDFGNIRIGKKLYECENKKALTSALINIDLDAQ